MIEINRPLRSRLHFKSRAVKHSKNLRSILKTKPHSALAYRVLTVHNKVSLFLNIERKIVIKLSERRYRHSQRRSLRILIQGSTNVSGLVTIAILNG
jgi:hypothetical protein